ncbi:MAG: nucleoside deaminase [Phycisphaeraceae bacterium]|nr:nucleoside deaminase [Phycisphaeraceae bacterium]
MARAMELARQAAAIGEVPVGAVVYRGGQILGEGMNLRERDEDPTAHAEIVAMRAAARAIDCWRLDDCSLAVTLEPCPMCAGAMVNARLPRLVYGAADPKMGCVDTLYQLCTEPRFNHRLTVVRGVMAEESGALLREFFRQRRG